MGCNNTKLEPTHQRTESRTLNNNGRKKQVAETEKERESRIAELLLATEQNATMILEQLKENDALSRSVVKNGGVSFTATLEGEIDENRTTLNNQLPAKLLNKLHSRNKHSLGMDERNILADVIREDESRIQAQKVKESKERHLNAQLRREEMLNGMREKVKQKWQNIAEMHTRKKDLNYAKETPNDRAAGR